MIKQYKKKKLLNINITQKHSIILREKQRKYNIQTKKLI